MNWKHWLLGLAAAAIQAAAGSLTGMIVAPETFNVHQLAKVGELALVNGLVGAALYLKQSPVPADPPKTGGA